jgi:ATP-dependent DNA ligase
MNLNAFFNELAENPSRLYKTARLQENADNGLLREVIRLALDPFTQFYIRKIPEYTPSSSNEPIKLAFALDSLGDLSMRLVTGNAGINHLKGMLEALSPDDAKVIERIIKKDLKCGVSVATANDVWMGLIKEYPVMLCSGYDQKLVDKIEFPAYVQLKEDGMRFNAIVIDGKCEFKSRNGKTLDLLGNLEAEFVAMSKGMDCVFDGELLVKIDGKIADRQTGNGILSKAGKGTISAKEAELVCATVWDHIPYAYFIDGYCPVPYSTRFKRLEDSVVSGTIGVVPTLMVDSLDEAQALFEQYLIDGKEGIILKSMDGEWEDKRSKSQIKFKGELECDLLVTGIENGTGKYQGMLGSLICASSDNLITVNVGSGLNDEQRRSLNSDIIGRVVAVKYNARIKSKDGTESLFLPIFIELRDDKTEADSSTDIK